MSWRGMWCLVAATAGAWSVARAQAFDSTAAAAAGVYRPPSPPDTAAPATPAAPAATDPAASAPSEAVSRPSVQEIPAPVSPTPQEPRDTARPADTAAAAPDRVPSADTSLTARMDVRRGGGLSPRELPDLRSTAALAGRYTIFLSLMEQSPVGERLTGDSALTVLAPTDSAFTRLPAREFARLNNDPALRDAWLETVLLNGSLGTRELLSAGKVASRDGRMIQFSRRRGGRVHAGRARLVQPDLTARNGTLHGVDLVRLPEATSTTP